MKTTIQFVNCNNKPTAADLVQRKLDKLENKFDFIVSGAVTFTEENDSTGKGKLCSIELQIPGPNVRASSNEESLEAAAAETVKDLEKQLKKEKAKMQSY
ncbi:MAG TPA: HPF/RaiA family ribosome-associated protein [Salinimicrobium sp.]|nr:HPF/RaiA family ribosome-associated protein [Salinimicrobium sp.]